MLSASSVKCRRGGRGRPAEHDTRVSLVSPAGVDARAGAGRSPAARAALGRDPWASSFSGDVRYPDPFLSGVVGPSGDSSCASARARDAPVTGAIWRDGHAAATGRDVANQNHVRRPRMATWTPDPTF